jgi:octaprenyl-diphosphate synthase
MSQPVLASKIADASSKSKSKDVLGRLAEVPQVKAEQPLAERLLELRAFVHDDLAAVEEALRAVNRQPAGERIVTPMHASGHHLLSLGGKRLRPLCVALAARMGEGFGPTARALAVAVELIHNATLLHDDVVDVGDLRRGAPAARVLYGNAASIFAGDWLLIEALSRVHQTGDPALVTRALGVLHEMLDGESLQLKNRGKLRASLSDYFQVVEGKTAALFGYALYSGGRAGQLGEQECAGLEVFGRKLGVAFQVIDDVLDVAGDTATLGKSTFADLREGKATYPLLVATADDPALVASIEAALETGGIDQRLEERVAEALRRTGAVEETRRLAKRLSDEANAALADLPPSPAKLALLEVADAMLQRKN